MRIILTLMSVIGLFNLAIDIMLPAFPYLKSHFNTDQQHVQITFVVYLVAFGASSLFYGYISDLYGRKKTLTFGVILFMIGSIISALSEDVNLFTFSRIIQGLGAGSGTTIGYAAVSDIYKGDQLSKKISTINMMMIIIPALAPILGATLVAEHGINYVFNTILIASIFNTIIFIVFFEETLPKEVMILNTKKKYKLIPKYISVLKDRNFLIPCIIQGLCIGSIISDMSNTPFIFIQEMDVPLHQYGYYMTVLCLSYLVGTLINQKFILRIGSIKMIGIGLCVQIFSHILMLILNHFFALTSISITAIWIITNFAVPLVANNSVGYAIDSCSQSTKALGSSLIQFIELFFGGLFTYTLSMLYNGSIVPSSCLDIFSCISAGSLFLFLKAKKQSNASNHCS